MLKMFTVHDSKAEAFIQPFYELATGAAIRAFSSEANNQEHQFHRHAGDYTLFELGTFDQVTGQIELLPAMKNLGTAIQFITTEPGELLAMSVSETRADMRVHETDAEEHRRGNRP